MDELPIYSIDLIASNIKDYTYLELNLISRGISDLINDLSEDNHNYESTKEILLYRQLSELVEDRLDELDDMM